MRITTSPMLAKLNQQYGSEPYFIIGINWVEDKIKYYSDKTIYDNGTVIAEGRILKIDNIESILSLDQNNTSVSINVTLDDSDLSFLKLMDNVDIHLRKCSLYLQYSGLPFQDKLELFEGHIVSDTTWDDTDRTMKISMTTVFANYEAGFSPEEGDVADLREDLVGKAWPMAFGTVYKMPITRITDIPTGVTTEPMGFHDYWLDWQVRHSTLATQSYNDVAAELFLESLGAAYAAVQESEETGEPPDYTESDDLAQQATDVLALANQSNQKQVALQGLLAQQLSYSKTSTYVLTDYPIDLEGVFEVGGTYVVGSLKIAKRHKQPIQGVAFFSFTGPYHSLFFAGFTPTKKQAELIGPTQIGVISPQTGNITDLEGAVSRDVSAFVYIEAGSSLKFLGNYPVKYVVSIISGTIITGIYAHREFESYSRRMLVPKSFYKKITVIAQSSRAILLANRRFQSVGVRLFRPLSTLLNQRWSDNELFATVQSPVGPDFQSILRYIITTFTVYTVDEESLATIPPFRLNFAVLELKDVLTLIKEICYQCKTAVSLNNGKFKFIYLPKYNPSGVTISLEDIIEKSLIFSFTSTEDIITKMIGTWRFDWSDEKQNRIVIRQNTDKYGTIEESYDYYCFNVQKAVEATMSFWLYRKSNSWKKLKFKVPLKYIILENYDIINLDETFCSAYGINGGVATPAIVQNITLDVDNRVIELELELPIKLGENTFDRNYWPSGDFRWMGQSEVSQIFNHVLPPKQWDGISYTPLAQLEPIFVNSLGDQNSVGTAGVTDIQWDNPSASMELFKEFDFDMGTQNPPGTGNYPTKVVGDYGGTLGDYIAPQMRMSHENVSVAQPQIAPKFPVRYGDVQSPTTPTPTPTPITGGGAIPGFVVSGSGSTYQVTIYPNGLNKASKTVSVKILQIDSSETIPPTTALTVMAIGSGKTLTYYAQPPIWV